jgi:hypothetical protein
MIFENRVIIYDAFPLGNIKLPSCSWPTYIPKYIRRNFILVKMIEKPGKCNLVITGDKGIPDTLKNENLQTLHSPAFQLPSTADDREQVPFSDPAYASNLSISSLSHH